MRLGLAVLAVAWLIAVLGATAITASAAGHEAEVRITAQRLADGRTEFALQQRDGDWEWGERLLPRARFFPATATVGRWLSSTPLTVRAPGAGDDAAGTEVRIIRETCRRKMQRYRDIGVDRLMCFMQIGDLGHESIMQSLRLTAGELLPAMAD